MAAQTARIGKVAFLVAMKEEAAPFIAALGLTRRPAAAPQPTIVYEGSYKGATVLVYSPGESDGKSLVGTDFAFLTTFLAHQTDKPDLFVNAGTCGGFAKRGGAIGDVYVVDKFQYHDRRVAIPGYDVMCVGERTSQPSPKLVAALGCKTGPCTTGNSLDYIPDDTARMESFGACCKDMEAASIAWAAELTSTPLVAVKVVTDIVDGGKPTHEEFLANLQTAAASLQDVLPKVLDHCVGKTKEEL